MSLKQILYPNLDNDPNHPLYILQGGQILTDWYGWCLAVVAGSYGAKGSSYSAKTAWQSNQTKHYDRNIPDGLFVPLWYEGGQYGHVVIGYRNGNQLTIYSSPYTHKPTFEVFRGELNYILDYVGSVYRVGSFTGWSETVLDSYVIKEEEPIVAEPEPIPEPEPTPEPEPVEEPQGTQEPVENSDENNNNDIKEDNDMSTKEPVEPAQEQDQQLVIGYIQEASKGFTFPNWVKFTAYIVGDILLVGALLIPDVVNALEAPTVQIWAEYSSRVLLEAGISVLTIFKLIKK